MCKLDLENCDNFHAAFKKLGNLLMIEEIDKDQIVDFIQTIFDKYTSKDIINLDIDMTVSDSAVLTAGEFLTEDIMLAVCNYPFSLNCHKILIEENKITVGYLHDIIMSNVAAGIEEYQIENEQNLISSAFEGIGIAFSDFDEQLPMYYSLEES